MEIRTHKPKEVFEARATVLDVTSGTPVTIDTNALLRITLTDGGTTGPDRIGATLWRDDGALYYSSLWDGSETDEDEIDGGGADGQLERAGLLNGQPVLRCADKPMLGHVEPDPRRVSRDPAGNVSGPRADIEQHAGPAGVAQRLERFGLQFHFFDARAEALRPKSLNGFASVRCLTYNCQSGLIFDEQAQTRPPVALVLVAASAVAVASCAPLPGRCCSTRAGKRIRPCARSRARPAPWLPRLPGDGGHVGARPSTGIPRAASLGSDLPEGHAP